MDECGGGGGYGGEWMSVGVWGWGVDECECEDGGGDWWMSVGVWVYMCTRELIDLNQHNAIQ